MEIPLFRLVVNTIEHRTQAISSINGRK